MRDFRRLLKYLKPHWFAFTAAIIAMILAALFESALGALIVPIFEQTFQSGAAKSASTLFGIQKLIPNDDWLAAWRVISLLLVALTLLSGIAEFLSAYLMAKIGQSAVLTMRLELYEHLLNQSSSFFERHRTNFLVSRLVTSAAAIELAVSSTLRDLLREGVMLVFCIGAAFYFSWRLMLGALVVTPIIAILTSRFSRALRHLAEETFEGSRLLTDVAQEALSNQSIVKAYRAEARERTRFLNVARRIARANLRAALIAATSPPVINLIGMVFVIALLFFGLREIETGRMVAAQFFAFLYFLFRSYDPMRKISRQHNQLTQGLAAARDVWGTLDDDELLVEKPNAVELSTLADKIELRNVSFQYKDEFKSVLRDVSLEIPKGAVVALVGASGGGKSSLIKLIQRVYDPTEGAIFWDGMDLRDAKLASLKKQIALVTQETVLFNDSVLYNISYGKPDATRGEIEQAARVAFAHDFISEMPEGYDTIVGERGILLSGGQRQRIAIARAILVDAPLLILDEATSALDAESERLVQLAIENLMQHRTSVVIAHRLSTVRRANKIAVMEGGRIIETGTHEELIGRNGTYRRLYELQFTDEEPLRESAQPVS